ncbi:3897_t:CDS:2, partial [Gigaspora margarita]
LKMLSKESEETLQGNNSTEDNIHTEDFSNKYKYCHKAKRQKKFKYLVGLSTFNMNSHFAEEYDIVEFQKNQINNRFYVLSKK